MQTWSRFPVVATSSFKFARRWTTTHFAPAKSSVSETTDRHAELSPGSVFDFAGLGIRPAVVNALRTAFPGIRKPTKLQAELIPKILEGKDVLMQDVTGSGKTFGVVLALLSKPREGFGSSDQQKHAITSLVVVPHGDLAQQIYYWIRQIVEKSIGPRQLKSIAQVLVRDNRSHLSSGLADLRKESPHILIGTPQALLDVHKRDAKALQFPRLSTVYVDEIDYLVPTVKKSKGYRTKALKRIEKHPGPTRELLNIIYSQRPPPTSDESVSYIPQFIASSATFPSHLREYVSSDSGWVDADQLEFLEGSSAQEWEGPRTTHSVLVVLEDETRNIIGAVDREQDGSNEAPESDVVSEEPPTDSSAQLAPTPKDELDRSLSEEFSRSESPFNPNALEAIATAFALDVPSNALLVIPPNASVRRAVFDLRAIGVNSQGLDLLEGDLRGRSLLLSGDAKRASTTPTLLVATPPAIRGVDLPELSHVFLLGVPAGKGASDTYMHVAGRVGRFGRGGKVISVVEGIDGGTRGAEAYHSTWELSGPVRARTILQIIGEQPVKLEHFE